MLCRRAIIQMSRVVGGCCPYSLTLRYITAVNVFYRKGHVLFRIVLDTNVLIAALMSQHGASNKLLRLIGTGKFDVVLSVALTLEYESVAKRYSGTKIPYTFDEIDEILDFLRDSANQRGIYFLWRMAVKDPDDGLVLDLAANSDCQYIVTFNIKDFPDIEQFSLKAVTPKQFLEILENEE